MRVWSGLFFEVKTWVQKKIIRQSQKNLKVKSPADCQGVIIKIEKIH